MLDLEKLAKEGLKFKDSKICKIYKTTQNSYNEQAYCQECSYCYTDCLNYKQLCKVQGEKYVNDI